MSDIYSEMAQQVFGAIPNSDGFKKARQQAKSVMYLRHYSGGEIKAGLRAGQYPITDIKIQP